MRNRVIKAKMRTIVKQAQTAVVADDKEAAQAAVVAAISQLDKAAQKGVLHPNNAARRKARLMKRLNAM
jgi:small subunit ribosomal protein S20